MAAAMALSPTDTYLQDLNELNFCLFLVEYSGPCKLEHAQLFLNLNGLPEGRNSYSRELLSRVVYKYVGQNVSLDEVVGPRAREQGFCSLLHVTVSEGFKLITRLLLDWGVDPNDCNELHRSPLHMAASCGCKDTAFLLLAHGADPTAVHISGKTALHFACEGSGNVWLVGRLLELGLNADVADKLHGNTPLHLAARNGKSGAVELLIWWEADMTARNAEGCTPVHLSVLHRSVLQIFLDQNVDLKCTNVKGLTPLQFVPLDDSETARLIISRLVMDEAITGIPMDKANANCMGSCQNWKIIRDKCLKEIEKMKTVRCCRGLTCFQVYSMSTRALGKRVNTTRRMMEILQGMHFEDMFVNYGEKIYEKIDDSIDSRNHGYRASNFVKNALGHLLPHVVTEKISEYLNPEDISYK